MRSPCLCGDPFCASCGSAQGTLESEDDLTISIKKPEKSVFYDEESRRWFFYDENGNYVGPYDNELLASAALLKYTIEISKEDFQG